MNRFRAWFAAAALPLLAGSFVAGGCAGEVKEDAPSPLYETGRFEYPVELWDDGVEGEALLLLRVTAEGVVDSVVVHESSGWAAFDSSAVAGARELSFLPGSRNGRHVDMWARLPVRFTREAGAVAGSPLEGP